MCPITCRSTAVTWSSRRSELPEVAGGPISASKLRPWAAVIAAVAGPAALTAILVSLPLPESRDYIFLYLGLVAALGLFGGLLATVPCAAVSFLLVDYFFVPPYRTLTIADEADVVNLLVFLVVAAAVGLLGSRRRLAQIRAEKLAKELRAANLELERLDRERGEAAAVAVRLAQAEQQVRVLEASDRVRADLLGNVSHELRTPLASILTGATDMLRRPGLSGEALAEIEALVGAARRLERLVGDLLDMARIEGHALTLEPVEVDLGEAIEAAAGRLHLASPSRAVEVALPPDGLEVLADWDRLGQILDNLLQNADQHAPPGTAITVSGMAGKRSMVVVRVIDRGPGVAAEERERIFERFARGATESGTAADAGLRSAGTGLGLAIVRGLIQAHAGRIWMEEPGEGEGGRFAFTLPGVAGESTPAVTA
jgi:K+-sensing histidine kinase KdpD